MSRPGIVCLSLVLVLGLPLLGVWVSSLPSVTTWADVIELDEERL
jgi:hypothetical protein